ncbi:MAG: DUF2061 domain-containing protein [Acidimicrobiales bacterium]
MRDLRVGVDSPARPESSRRIHLAKALSWRILASLTTFVIVWTLTGEPVAGALVGGTEAIAKVGLYYWHERTWAAVLGRR